MWLEETISHYDILREVGKGAFATVHEVRRKNDGFYAACKMIDRKRLEQNNSFHYPIYTNHRHIPTSSRSTSMFERLNAEITIHHQVKHPNIVELLNCFYDDKHIYLILELCPGGDLEHYLKDKQILSESETQHVVKQVVDGLVYLHSHGIIHRDIKLSNLLLTNTLEVKIGDFGLAKRIHLTREQNNETMCGTPNYISPEIASRTPHGFATDVWSLGILIVTLLTGHPPFDTDNVDETLSKVTHEKYELPTTFSEEAQDLVNSTLQKAAELRPNILEIRDHAFFTKDFSRSSPSNHSKYASWGPAVDRSHDSGFVENIGQQRSTSNIGSNSTSTAKGTYIPRIFSPNSTTSPSSSQHYESINVKKLTRNKSYDYYLNHSVQQQPIYRGQSPSMDISLRHNESTYSATNNLTDHRPTSAASSIRSQDSGVAQSDPKTSIDCSAKSEPSMKISLNNSTNYYFANNSSSNGSRHRSTSSSNTHQQSLTSQHQTPNTYDGNSEHSRDKPRPLNTQRLRFLRQATRSYIMSIMENGEVVLETTRTKGSKRRIVDVFRVSSDGLHIITYTPNSRHGSPVGDRPPPIPKDKNSYQEYHFDQLPPEYWKKYQSAHKFVTLVRSRTPKIVLYTADAKSTLMETTIEFESIFLCGIKISIYRENFKTDDPLKIKIVNNDDKSESLLDYDRVAAPNISAIEHFSPEIRQMINSTITCYKFCLSKDKILEECQKLFPTIQTFPVQFGKKHGQNDPNRPSTPCSLGRSISSKFGGSSSTINESYLAASSSPVLNVRPDFSSETDIRKSRASSTTSAGIVRNQIQHSTSSSALRTTDYPVQVTYQPQSSLSTSNPSHSQSTHIPESLSTSSFSNRPTVTTNNTNISASTTSLNSTASGGTTTITTQISGKGLGSVSIPLTRKSITEYSNRTFRVIFSDDSVMIIREDSPDGQIFIDAQGRRYSFDRRQSQQPEAIQERLALFYQNEQDSIDYVTS